MARPRLQVYFHWVVRDSPSLAYFRDTLETIAQDDVRARTCSFSLPVLPPRCHCVKWPAAG